MLDEFDAPEEAPAFALLGADRLFNTFSCSGLIGAGVVELPAEARAAVLDAPAGLGAESDWSTCTFCASVN